jgi:hypothetical protein
VLEGKEWRRLIDTIPTDTVRDLHRLDGLEFFEKETLRWKKRT